MIKVMQRSLKNPATVMNTGTIACHRTLWYRKCGFLTGPGPAWTPSRGRIAGRNSRMLNIISSEDNRFTYGRL